MREPALCADTRATYWGNDGFVQSKKPAQPLEVAEEHGQRYAEFAGVAKGRVLPTVTLSPGGAIASFWIFGTDMQSHLADGHRSRCVVSYDMWVSMSKGPSVVTVAPERARNFDWCGSVTIYPVVAGDTGSDPHFLVTACLAPTPDQSPASQEFDSYQS